MQSGEEKEVPERLEPIYPRAGTQYEKVIKTLLEAKGEWVNFQRFVREMYLTQAHYVIHMLENKYHWPIEHSTFEDQHGFKSYRLPKEVADKFVEI